MDGNTILVVVGTIAGVIVGYALNELSLRNREKRTAQKKRQNVRTLLWLENQRNLESLDEIWKAVTRPPEPDHKLGVSTEAQMFIYRKRLAT